MEFRRSAERNPSQKWIDTNLPICPLCRSPSLWGTATEVDGLALDRWLFRCPDCMAVLSTIPDFSVSALISPVTVIKTAVARNIRIENIGKNGVEDFVGREFPLAELQRLANKKES